MLKDSLISFLSSSHFKGLNSIFMRGRVPVFCLHRFIANISPFGETHSPEHIRDCIRLLKKKGIKPISLRELSGAIARGEAIEPGHVAFTIDDGHWDQAELGAEVFLEEDCPVTIFVITGLLDGNLWPTRLEWIFEQIPCGLFDFQFDSTIIPLDTRTQTSRKISFRNANEFSRRSLGTRLDEFMHKLCRTFNLALPEKPPTEHRAMTWEQARSLEARGVEFGSHSVNHYSLAGLNDAEAAHEIRESWLRLSQELTNPLPVMAWPFGRTEDFLQRDMKIAKKAGYVAAMATNHNYTNFNDSKQYPYSLNRLAMPQTTRDLLLLSTWIERAHQIIRSRRLRK